MFVQVVSPAHFPPSHAARPRPPPPRPYFRTTSPFDPDPWRPACLPENRVSDLKRTFGKKTFPYQRSPEPRSTGVGYLRVPLPPPRSTASRGPTVYRGPSILPRPGSPSTTTVPTRFGNRHRRRSRKEPLLGKRNCSGGDAGGPSSGEARPTKTIFESRLYFRRLGERR